MLRTGIVGIGCVVTGMGTRFGVSAFGTCVAAEGMVRPSGISNTLYLLTTAIAVCVVAVHIRVFVGIYRFCTAVFAVTTVGTLAV